MTREGKEFYALIGKANEGLDGLLAQLPSIPENGVATQIAKPDARTMRSSGKTAMKLAETALDETTRIVNSRLKATG